MTPLPPLLSPRSLPDFPAFPRNETKFMAAKKATKYVYHFGKKTDGDGKMKELLGGKGANLAEMTRIGLPVPPVSPSPRMSAPTTTQQSHLSQGAQAQMEDGVKLMEKQLGKKFGDKSNPLAFRSLRCPRVHAGHDGHHPQPWPQRRNGGRPC